MLTDAERDELLIRLDERVYQTHKALFGNGRPGLINDVVRLKEDMRKREIEAAELRGGAAGKRKDALVGSGVLTVILVSVLTAVKEVLGF